MKINVLGTPYLMRRVNLGQDEFMDRMHYGGYCDEIRHEIVILNLASCPDWKDEPEEIRSAQDRQTIRHELIHAFLSESGLQANSFAPEKAWAKNEEMVDWITLQSPKIFKAFQQANAI